MISTWVILIVATVVFLPALCRATVGVARIWWPHSRLGQVGEWAHHRRMQKGCEVCGSGPVCPECYRCYDPQCNAGCVYCTDAKRLRLLLPYLPGAAPRKAPSGEVIL